MTGMVRQIDSTLFSPSAGRIVSAAGHNSPVWGGFHTIHYSYTPGTGATLLPVFTKLIQRDMKEPRIEDYLTEDDYEAALDAYEAAVYEAEERAMEEYYEKKQSRKKR